MNKSPIEEMFNEITPEVKFVDVTPVDCLSAEKSPKEFNCPVHGKETQVFCWRAFQKPAEKPQTGCKLCQRKFPNFCKRHAPKITVTTARYYREDEVKEMLAAKGAELKQKALKWLQNHPDYKEHSEFFVLNLLCDLFGQEWVEERSR